MDGVIFTKETSKLIVDWVGDALKPKVPFIIRGLVKPTLGIVIGLVNKHGDRVIPDKIDGYLNGVIVLAKAGDFDSSGEQMGLAIEALVSEKPSSIKEKFFINIGETIMTGIEWVIEVKKEGK